MNFNLSQIPERTAQPRQHGLTMVMDKGLSYGEADNFISVGKPHTDIVKLGFGTSFVTPNLRKKIENFADFDVLSNNPHQTASVIKERLGDNGIKNVKIIKK